MTRRHLRRAARTLLFLGALFPVFAAPSDAADVTVEVVDGKGAPVANAVAVVRPASGDPAGSPEASPARIEQVDREFIPLVTAVYKGSRVTFPNHDDTQHHVYSFSDAKRFELPLYRGEPKEPVLFDTPGVVSLGCNIHDWMSAWIFVADTPLFATSGPDGRAVVRGVPPGPARVEVWHPHLKGSGKRPAADLSVAGGGAAARVALELRKPFRPPKAPSGGGGYR